jgi:hypothetical protein
VEDLVQIVAGQGEHLAADRPELARLVANLLVFPTP